MRILARGPSAPVGITVDLLARRRKPVITSATDDVPGTLDNASPMIHARTLTRNGEAGATIRILLEVPA